MRSAVLFLLATTLFACGGAPRADVAPDSTIEATEDAKTAEAAIKERFGVAAAVTSFRVLSGASIVTVRLAGTPLTGDAVYVRKQIGAIVRFAFRSPVERVDVKGYEGATMPMRGLR